MSEDPSPQECSAMRDECHGLRARVLQLEGMLLAIQKGQVDALVIEGAKGPYLVTLEGMDNAYRTLVETMTEGVLTLDSDDVILYGNRSIAGILREPLEKIIGSRFTEWIEPGEREQFSKLKTWAENGLGQGFLTLRNAGRLIPAEFSIKNALINGTDVHFCIVTDVTDLKRTEAERDATLAQLRQSQKMEAIGTLAGGIAHDFNNIITSILGNAELARQDLLGLPHVLLSVEEIIKAAQRARTLVQMILTFSHRQITVRKPMLLAPIIQETVRLLRSTLPGNVQVTADCAEGVPPVLADANQIQQVLLNLTNNSVVAMGGNPGHIDLRLDSVLLNEAVVRELPALQPLSASGRERVLRLEVRDDGAGMDKATLARLFEPFFTTKPMGSGSGLGLAVAHGIIQGHEGVITVESEKGKGSVFRIYLPAAEGAEVVSEEAGRLPSMPGQSGGRPLHILYLDDDQSLVLLVDRMLHRKGLRVSAHTRQREALEALRAAPADFDLVVTDYNMPGMSGLEVASEVHQINANLPVALASGYIDDALQLKANAAGVVELVYKANAVEDFCGALHRLAQIYGTRDS